MITALVAFALGAWQLNPYPRPPSKHLAYWKTVSTRGPKGHQILIVADKPTAIELDYDDSGYDKPTVAAYRTPSGAIVGNVVRLIDGPALWTEPEGFAAYRGKLTRLPNLGLIDHKGDYALYLTVVDGMPPQTQGCDHAKLYHRGVVTDVGLVRRAHVKRDGTVVGWYPVVNGKPYTGEMWNDQPPAENGSQFVYFQRRYFRFKNGKRFESFDPLK